MRREGSLTLAMAFLVLLHPARGMTQTVVEVQMTNGLTFDPPS